MPPLMTLKLYVNQTRLFWRGRLWLSRLGFIGHRQVFAWRHRLRESRTHGSTLAALAQQTLGLLAVGLFLAIAVQIADPYLKDMYRSYGLEVSREPYTTFLGTVTAMGALLIGLYYAATTAIGGAIYARVPNNIRDLLARERVGNVYMQYLALTTFVGIVLLAFQSAGYPPVMIAIPLFFLSGGVAIVAFVKLGARAFYLFDPTMLSYDLFEQLRRNYLQMCAGEYRWLDPSFQRHAHRKSRSAIETLSTLAELTATEPHLSGQPYLMLCKQLLAFLIVYEPQKKRIPTNSLWYAQRYSHRDWYQTPDTETSLAHTAAIQLSPKTVSDTRWLEKKILPIVYRCFRENLAAHRYDLALELLGYVDTYAKQLTIEHQVATAFEMVAELTTACGDVLFEAITPENEHESLERMGIADALGAIPISIFLAYANTIEAANKKAILRALQKVRWTRLAEVYQTGAPEAALERLEWMRPRIEFEIQSEGKQTSPGWYIGELILQPIAENAKATTECLFVAAQALYQRWLDGAAKSKLHWMSATVLSREIEYWEKVGYQLARLRNQWEDLSGDRRIEGLPWPELDLDKLDQARSSRVKYILQSMSDHVPLLNKTPRPDSYPDFAGRFLHAVGEQLFTAMLESDADTVASLFPKFFRASLVQFNLILEKSKDVPLRPDVVAKLAVAPVLDLMHLSGYAILFAEFHRNQLLSDVVLKVWNEYLDAGPAEAKVSFLASAISLTESAFELAHRSLIRTRWMQEVSNRLRQLKSKAATESGVPYPIGKVIDHESDLIKVFARSELGSFYDGIDIFIEKCIRARPDLKETDFGYRRGQLGEDLARELERKANIGE